MKRDKLTPTQAPQLSPTKPIKTQRLPMLALCLAPLAFPVHAAVTGQLEEANCNQVKGWVWNDTAPTTTVKVSVYNVVSATQKTLLATLNANLFRQDLFDKGIGDGKHGFAFALPASIRNAATHKLSVTIQGTTTELTGSPKTTAACYNVLNDSGWQKCSTNTANGLNCPLGTYPLQDGDTGRDATARAGKLVKSGAGNAGFDFTKIANNGSKLPKTAKLGKNPTDWACTLDNHTGLLWEVKTDFANDLRHYANQYSYYEKNPVTGEFIGTPNAGFSCTGGIKCDTYSYAQELNRLKLCGKTTWHLPKINELAGILDYSAGGYWGKGEYFVIPDASFGAPYWYATSTLTWENFSQQIGYIGMWKTGDSIYQHQLTPEFGRSAVILVSK